MKAPPAIVAGLLLLTPPLALNAQSPEPPDCVLEQVASIELLGKENVLVPVSVDGHSYTMALDTTDTFSMVFKTSAAALKLKRRPVRLGAQLTSGGKDIVETASIESFSVGKIDFGKTRLYVSPRKRTEADVPPIIGTLGMDVFFGRFNFELDLARNRLNVFTQNHCRGQGVYWSDTFASAPLTRGYMGTYFVLMELEGRKLETLLSSDDADSMLKLDVTRRFFGFDLGSPGIEIRPAGNGLKREGYYRAMQLTAPGLDVRHTKILLVRGDDDCRLVRSANPIRYDRARCNSFPLALGRSVLRELRLFFALSEGTVYFTAAAQDSPKRPAAR
jgi:hypothetical protein